MFKTLWLITTAVIGLPIVAVIYLTLGFCALIERIVRPGYLAIYRVMRERHERKYLVR